MLWNLLFCAFASAQPSPGKMEQFITQLMGKMTHEEKAGQLNQYSADMAVTGSTLKPDYLKAVAQGQVGSIFNAFGPKATREMQKVAVEQTRLKIPLLFGHDVIHGHRTIFPIPLGEAASWDLALMEKSAEIAAREAAADGIHWSFAPMVDISRDPRWGRVAEGAGEDPYLASEIARVRVRGFQGKDERATDRVMATVKHFAAYGAPEAGRDYGTVSLSDRDLLETYMPPYQAAVRAGARSVMTAFNDVNGIPATAHRGLLTDILRKQWGFKGLVVTDYTAVNELIPHGVARDEKHAAELALKAGADMDMMSSAFVRHLPELVRKGVVSEKDLDRAVRRVLEAKYRRGLFDDPYRYSDEARAKKVIMSAEHLDHAREISRRSIVLLKNSNGVLPLKRKGTVALIGPMVENQRDQIGNWSSAGDWKQSVSLAQGFREVAGDNVKVISALGANLVEDRPLREFLNRHGGDVVHSDTKSEDLLKEAVRVARRADVVVVALGETQGMSGEAASRSQIRVPSNQLELLRALKGTGKPLVLVLYHGRPLALEQESALADSVLATWFLGTQAGLAIADVLFGDVNPSGKLPMTFPRNEGQIPIYYSMKNTGRPYDPNEKYRSKYLDVGNDPLYPFGFGLSYTQFEISEPRLSTSKLKPGQKLKVKVSVSNRGSVAGRETVQLYVRDVVASVTPPLRRLRRFQQVDLKPGETRELEFELGSEDWQLLNQQLKWVIEPGEFRVMVGGNSRDTKEASFTLLAK